jgi:hypothetical protein
MAQPRQRRTGKAVDGLAAGRAAEARQAMRLTPASTGSVLTMRAAWVRVEDRVQRLGRGTLLAEPLDRALPLHPCQLIGPRQPLSECFGTHRIVLHIS